MTPSAQPPTLLSLPREIRDIILSFVHENITIPWLWRTYSDPDLPPDIAPITIHSAPLRAVSLTHPQLHAEYAQVTSTWKLAATSDLDISSVGWRQAVEFAEEDLLRRPSAFRLISEITLLLRITTLCSELESTQIPWWHIEPFLASLFSLSPYLQTLRIAYYQPQVRVIPHRECGYPDFEYSFESGEVERFFVPRVAELDVPGVWGQRRKMVLSREGEGIKVSYDHVRRKEGREGIYHRVTRVGVCLYMLESDGLMGSRDGEVAGRGNSQEGNARILYREEVDEIFVPDEVLNAPRMGRAYPEHVLGLLWEDEREEVRGWAGRMKEFREFEEVEE